MVVSVKSIKIQQAPTSPNGLNPFDANPKLTFCESKAKLGNYNQNSSIPPHQLNVATHPLFLLVYSYVISS